MGVIRTENEASGIHDRSTVDRFTPEDVHALHLMSGCEPGLLPSSPRHTRPERRARGRRTSSGFVSCITRDTLKP